MALGIEPQASFEKGVIQLDLNDFIIYYTDGVTEVIDTTIMVAKREGL